MVLVLAWGLVRQSGPPEKNGESEHQHPPGPHGGSVVAIDSENQFHAEVVVEPGGVLRLYTFGREVSEPHPVAARIVCAAVRGHVKQDEYAVMFRPDPLPVDPAGTASRFVGRLPGMKPEGHLELVVWSLSVGPERYQFAIHLLSSAPDPDAETALYSAPGGKYTEADIRTNGSAPAAQRFRGERSAHDSRPAVGEQVCPVSRVRGSAKFPWVIDGRKYLFCCPPCIDDFVKAAKQRPNEVREPDFYRHQ